MDILIGVEGHPNLARNKKSGAIVNINKSSIRDARKAKAARKKNSERVDHLEYEMSQIKDLLQQLVDKNG